MQTVSLDILIKPYVEHVHHRIELQATKKMLGTDGRDATHLQIERLQPQIAFESLRKELGAFVTDTHVAVNRNTPDTKHRVEIGPTVPQAVLPRFVVPFHRLIFDERCENFGTHARQVT